MRHNHFISLAFRFHLLINRKTCTRFSRYGLRKCGEYQIEHIAITSTTTTTTENRPIIHTYVQKTFDNIFCPLLEIKL